MLRSRNSRIRALGGVRLAVGAGLLVAPKLVARTTDPSVALLVRTIGIRDVVLGIGSAIAPPGDDRRWGRLTLASDALDVLAGSVAIPAVGRRAGLTAGLVPLPFVAAGVWALRGTRQRGF